jgi:ATP-dependent RNA helicase DeaD
VAMTFNDFNLNEDIQQALDNNKYVTPTDIQKEAIPVLMGDDIDFVGQAKTGTGKTLSFLLPLISKIDPNDSSVQALCLAPTRELARQVEEEAQKMLRYSNIKTLCVFGGDSYERQFRALKKSGPQIVVGTPGRVLDLINRKHLKLNNTTKLILDEADEMLNMGFLEDVHEIISHMPEQKNIWMFSATMPGPIKNLIKKDFNEPYFISVKGDTLTNNDIEQSYYCVKMKHFPEAICRLLDHEKDVYALVFCRTRMDTKELADHLNSRGHKAETLHGEMGQALRNKAMANFKAKKTKLLICTDVAARGIDVDNLTHVINYDLPQDNESYIHRIGRTGRAGMKGKAVTLLDPRFLGRLRFIERHINAKIERKTLPSISELKKNMVKQEIDSMENMVNAIQEKSGTFKVDETFDLFQEIIKDMSQEDIAKLMFTRLFNAPMRRLNSLEAIDESLNPQRNGSRRERGGRNDRRDRDRGGKQERGHRGQRSGREERPGRKGPKDETLFSTGNRERNRKSSSWSRLYINVGRDDGVELKGLIKDISQASGLQSRDIQNVVLKNRFSFIDVPNKSTPKFIKDVNYTVNKRKIKFEISE